MNNEQLENIKKIYFQKINTGIKVSPPPWAVPDEDLLDWVPERGFLADYMKYVLDVSETPVIYHVASALSILSFSLAGFEVEIESFLVEDDERNSIVPAGNGKSWSMIPVLWSAIVGETGDRKSTAMDYGQRILEQAIIGTPYEYCKAPDFASPEALGEHMAQYGPAFTFRDELSTLLSPSRRVHLEHMKSTLLLIYENKPLKRRRVRDTAAASKKREEEHEEPTDPNDGVYEVLVEKPIEMIIGCIPPRVFANQTTIDDWDTGLLPRFTYWPGYLTPKDGGRPTSPSKQDVVEYKLASFLKRRLLNRISGKGRRIIMPFDTNYVLAEWDHDYISTLRGKVSSASYAYLKRSRATATKIAACLAAAEQGDETNRCESMVIEKHHAQAAVELLDIINPHVMLMFNYTKRSREGSREESLTSVVRNAKDGVTLDEAMELLDDAPSRATIGNDLKKMAKDGEIECLDLPTADPGRNPKLFFAARHKLTVKRRIAAAKKEVEGASRARWAEKKRRYREKQQARGKKA